MTRYLWLPLVLSLGACTMGQTRSTAPVSTAQPQLHIEQLIRYEQNLRGHTPQTLLNRCQTLRQRGDNKRTLLTSWQLATLISRVEGCAPLSEAVELLQGVLKQATLSEEAEWLIGYQLSLLKRHQKQLEEAAKTQQRMSDQLKASQTSRRDLEEKLRDLKRIETSINKRLDE